jgi:cytochrome b subunit of formate dehydrogenase
MECHGQHKIAQLSPEERRVMVAPGTSPSTAPATRPGLFVDATKLAGSIHGPLACTDCHAAARTLPHAQRMPAPTCDGTCHIKPTGDFAQGAHAAALARGDPQAPTCVTCHGGHDILPKRERASRTYPLNVVKVCGDCHQKHLAKAPGQDDGHHQVQEYLESVHGKAVTGGLAVAATCADCHGNHRILPGSDPRSSVHRDNIPNTCGQCHVGVSETYATSIHGEKLAKGDPKAPVCTDCHTAHSIARTNTPAFMLDIVNECGTCHSQNPGSSRKTSFYDTYRQSYHGQVTRLGVTRAARCSDCHGAHDIRRIADPQSRLNGEHRIETCRHCHADASPKFALFQPHADFHDKERYPLLHAVWLYFVVMMSLSFGFFGLHSVMWFGRSLIERVRHGPHPKFQINGHAIQRFNRVDRVNHAFVILTFFGLALTGLPLIYSDKPWAMSLANLFGGIAAAGILHRIFAIMLVGNFVVHGVGVVRRFKKYSIRAMLFGPTTLLPRPKDFTDCLGMIRWFFVGGQKPRFDRWTYWEKFDYTAEVGGSLIIGLSGLLLWFPLFFAQYMPGWIFNIATVVHGYEALLAVGFIFTIHFFNAHLRLEKFPVDDVMFTGRLSEEEFKHERAVEYERLVAEGKIAALRVKPPPHWYRIVAVAVGVVAMAIGTTLVALIVLAALKVI